jgi:hypothetical protein
VFYRDGRIRNPKCLFWNLGEWRVCPSSPTAWFTRYSGATFWSTGYCKSSLSRTTIVDDTPWADHIIWKKKLIRLLYFLTPHNKILDLGWMGLSSCAVVASCGAQDGNGTIYPAIRSLHGNPWGLSAFV